MSSSEYSRKTRVALVLLACVPAATVCLYILTLPYWIARDVVEARRAGHL